MSSILISRAGDSITAYSLTLPEDPHRNNNADAGRVRVTQNMKAHSTNSLIVFKSTEGYESYTVNLTDEASIHQSDYMKFDIGPYDVVMDNTTSIGKITVNQGGVYNLLLSNVSVNIFIVIYICKLCFTFFSKSICFIQTNIF